VSETEIPRTLSDEVVGLLSERMALLGEPTRIRILDGLRDGERNVQSIADALSTTQQNVSGHLRLLLAARVVSRRSAGRQVFYEVVDDTVFEVWERLITGLQSQGSDA
jgi:DNA-binding transcriptional ArsR family regulator